MEQEINKKINKKLLNCFFSFSYFTKKWDFKKYFLRLGTTKHSFFQPYLTHLLIKFHQSQNKGDNKFIIIGQSLGGAIATRALKDFKHKNAVDLLVLDSTFASYQDVAFRALKRRPMTLILSPFAYLVVSDSYSPEKHFENLGIRTLVIQSKKDKMVTFKNGEEVYGFLKK